MAAAPDIDPMHQFVIEPIFGSFGHNNPFVFTNSALWTLIVLGTIWVFMFGGMKRELIPGRWQVAVEGLIGFVDDMVNVNIGPEGKKYLPWVFTAFVFLLFAGFAVGIYNVIRISNAAQSKARRPASGEHEQGS